MKYNQETVREVATCPRIFSGHESFACRYGWLPKLYEAIIENPNLFANDEEAIMRLGLGRNMVKSLRFWGEAFGLTHTVGKKVLPTEFAHTLLNPHNGLDPYLETQSALWRLHWMLTVHAGFRRMGACVLGYTRSGNHSREICGFSPVLLNEFQPNY